MVRVGNGTSGSVGGSLSGRIAAGTVAAATVLPPSLLSTVWAPRCLRTGPPLRGGGGRAMFEEGEWAPEAGPGGPFVAPRPPSSPSRLFPEGAPPPPGFPLPSRPGPAEGSREQQQPQRRRLLRATLRRLQEDWAPRRPPGPGPDPDPEGGGGGGGGASDSGPEECEGSRRHKRRRKRRQKKRGLQERGQAEPSGPPAPGQKAAAAAATTGTPSGGGGGGGGGQVEAAAQSSGGLTAGSQLRAPETRLTRKQWRNRQTNKRRQKNKFRAGAGIGPEAKGVGLDQPCVGAPSEEPAGDQGEQDPSASMATELPTSRAASLRQRLEERLDSARFRYINQQLYTCSSQEAAQLFQEDPEALAVYHRGFARQVARWPEKPVQHFVRYLRNRPASLVVADFGCGDCTLARSLRNKVHCFDLVALDPQVTVCDMAQVPLEAESVDVAVFCLALMGTNLCEILEEANRVLRVGGTLLVAEVASRFPDVRAFVGALAQLGFRLLSKDVSSGGRFFYTFEFRKAAPGPVGGSAGKALRGLALRPCLYKRR
ncbi:ribosomal RNA-processing protein 8 [Pogona vitticeps]